MAINDYGDSAPNFASTIRQVIIVELLYCWQKANSVHCHRNPIKR